MPFVCCILAVALQLLSLACVVCAVDLGGRLTIACLGDSHTAGHTLPGGKRLGGYVYDLATVLGPARFLVSNFGRPGACAMIIPYAGTISFHSTTEWTEGVKRAADIYLVMLGTNDSGQSPFPNETFVRDYMKLIEELRTLVTAQRARIGKRPPVIYLMTTPPLFQSAPYWNPTVVSEVLSRVPGGLIADIATRTNSGLIDIYGAFVGAGFDRNITSDGVHLTPQGNVFMAQHIAASLERDKERWQPPSDTVHANSSLPFSSSTMTLLVVSTGALLCAGLLLRQATRKR